MLFNVGAGKRTGEEKMSISNHETIPCPKCGYFFEYDTYHERWYCLNNECKYSTREDIFKGEFLNSGEDKQ